MWVDSRDALSELSLPSRERVLDVGCGTGELSRILLEETDGEVLGLDADSTLLSHALEHVPVIRGDATRLPLANDVADLVICQALLVNLSEPIRAVREFARVSDDLVAAIEPDNAAVTVESTVEDERALEARARRNYLDGVETDVSLGGTGTRELFDRAGLTDVRTRRYDHVKIVEAPYDAAALEAARRKASGAGLASDRETLLSGAMTDEQYDDLRSDWREMGRSVIEQMRNGDYERREVVPFFVTVGRVE